MGSEIIIATLLEHRETFAKVVPFHPGTDRVISFDFSAGGDFPEDILPNTRSFMSLVNEKLGLAGARYGIGGYGELRTVYGKSQVFDGTDKGEEPRRLHLGIDIWGKPYTKVMSPLDGIIHSFAFNNQMGDYGATVILSHHLSGVRFHTLYGHLSLSSIKNMQEGMRVERGEVFAEFGIPADNGHWPPHLHFQLITDLGNWKGDYPGVCKYSERDRFLKTCPDPDLILQMNRYIS